MFRKILSLILVFVITISFICLPVSADVTDAFQYTVTSFWELLSSVYDTSTDFTFSGFWDALTDQDDDGDVDSDDYDAAYTSYVSSLFGDLGVTAVGDGCFVFYPDLSNYTDNSYISEVTVSGTNPVTISGSFTKVKYGVVTFGNADENGDYNLAPITGTYYAYYSYTKSTYTVVTPYQNLGWSKGYVLTAGDQLLPFFSIGTSDSNNYTFSAVLSAYYLIYPTDTEELTGYTSDTRVSSIDIYDSSTDTTAYYYGWYDESSELNVDESQTNIINETDNSVYNPVTNTTYEIFDWTYDYSTRTYSVTTTDDNSVSITYGDEYITYTVDDSTTYVYYVTATGTDDGDGDGSDGDGSGSSDEDDDDDDDGFFSWLGGKLGDLLGAIGDGLVSLPKNALEKVLDALIDMIEMIVDKLGTVLDAVYSIFDEVPALFDGYVLFLSAVFPFFPDEIITIVTFGIVAVVFVAIITKVIGIFT